MKNSNESRYYDILRGVLMGLLGLAILISIVIYGMETKAMAEATKTQAMIEEIEINCKTREATREQECADARQELHEYFSRQKMEETRAKTEEFQTSANLIQEETDEVIYEVVETTAKLEVPTVKDVTEKPEIMEVTEDDTNETQQTLFEEPETNIGEPSFVNSEEAEIKLIEAEADIEPKPEEEIEEDDWFELQPEVETQPKAEPISAPSVASTPVVATTTISYQENSNVNVSLQNFLNYNGMTLEDFIIRMTCMVYPEACGESFVGKQGVAEVAMNWIYSGLKTEWFDIASGFANIPVQRYYELTYSYNETDRVVVAECRQAVEAVIAGEHPVEDLLGVKPYYFLLPERSDPINVYIMTQATYQLWVGNQLYLGMEGIDWTLKGN